MPLFTLTKMGSQWKNITWKTRHWQDIMVIKGDKGENENIKVHDLDNYSIDAIDTILINTNWSNYNKLKNT